MGIPRILQQTERFLTTNSPQVLTALGVAGVITTAVLTGKASYRAAHILYAEEHAAAVTHDPLPDLKQKVKLVWTLYIPPVSVAAVTVATIIMANRIGTRRAAALAAAYAISEKSYEEYREKVKEKFTPKKEQELRDELAEDRANKSGVPPQTFIVPGSMKQRCYDQYSKRWFESTYDLLVRAANNVNHKMIHQEACSLNDFYSEIGLESVPYGEQVGWDAMDKLELVITSFLPEDNIPAISLAFYSFPKPNFASLH